MTFSVEIESPDAVSNEQHAVHIFVDAENLARLIRDLESLKKTKPGEHIHYFSESWGPSDLTTIANGGGNKITNHLKITLTT